MKKLFTIMLAMGTMVAFGQTNSATLSQTDGNNANVTQKNGATITATQNNTGGVANELMAKQYGTNKAKVHQNGTEQSVNLMQNGADNNIMNLNQINGTQNKFVVTQKGDANLVTTFNQKGDKNEATITQEGDRNKFGRVAGDPYNNNQHSLSNKLTATQKGADNEMIYMDQYGTSNTATFTQTGDYNFNRADQSGNNNQMTLKQKSYSGAAGNKNEIRMAYQGGSSNVMTVSQDGDKNVVSSVRQYSTGNKATVTQKGNVNTINTLHQSGTNNTSTITQKGAGQNHFGTFLQTGTDNKATISQDGSSNKVDKLEVIGTNNTTDVNQKGNSNYFGDQYGIVRGVDNKVDVDQLGDGNNAARVYINGHNRNNVTIFQDGRDNEAATSNSSSIIDVRGSDNNLTIQQIGGANRVDQVWLYGSTNNVTFKQKGDMNKIKGMTAGDYSSKIDGDRNQVYAEQTGDENIVVNGVDVLGSDNVVTLKQLGNKNEFELTGSPFEKNTVLVDQDGHENEMKTFVNGELNVLKLQIKSDNSEATVTQAGNENKVYAFNQTSKAVFEGQKLTIDQQGNLNEIKMNTKRSEVTVLQDGNDYAEVDNSGSANIFIDQQADFNFAKLKGNGNGQLKFTQKNGAQNRIGLVFNSDLATDEVNITQDGSGNEVKGLGTNEFGLFTGSSLSITQTGQDNDAMINGNGTISLTQTGNSNVASITQSAN
ncbi:hypothetical protein EMN47_10385 [Prolixibacteraceae bacterium JC049]|nr:hypothetical protein [Prolixibacteraceae bacterium JC049]